MHILANLKTVDLAGINFSEFSITYSIYSKMYDEFNIGGYNFSRKLSNLLFR